MTASRAPASGRPIDGDDDRDAASHLHKLAAALAGALTPADVVAAAVRHTADAFGASGTVVALRAEDDSPFLDLTDYLINGLKTNGVTNVLASPDSQDNVGSDEGFASSRIIRLGLRVRF